jgi:hypothetical protein
MAGTPHTGLPAVDQFIVSEEARLVAKGVPAGVARQGIASQLGRIHYRELSPDIRERATLELLRFRLRDIDGWCARWMASKDKMVPNWRQGLAELGVTPGPLSTEAFQRYVDDRAQH